MLMIIYNFYVLYLRFSLIYYDFQELLVQETLKITQCNYSGQRTIFTGVRISLHINFDICIKRIETKKSKRLSETGTFFWGEEENLFGPYLQVLI